MTKALNLQFVKNENRSLILYALAREGDLSRKELAAKLGLTPAAVTKICASLIETGFIREVGEADAAGKTGRREILLTLGNKDKICFGVNAEKDAVTLSLCTLDGRLVNKKRLPFINDVDEVLRQGVQFLDENAGLKDRIVGTGVCVIGSPDEDDFGIWKEKHLRQKFSDAFDLPVVIENNVKAFAESELIFGSAKSSGSVLFLKWGPGIGSAIVANGRVFSGNDSSATEIGHYIVNPAGRRCRCGRFGCLETEAGEDSILAELGTKLPLDEILKNCDNNTVNIIDHKINLVALALTNTATILNTEHIVLFGSMFNNSFVADKLIRQCIRYNTNLSEDMMEVSLLNGSVDYIGTAGVCAKKFFFESEA
ncbi:MAG: ROK family transcriptional regulator [Ruminococcaceae bacterium]|nr:ROK family transcriptional regulator [Oscillospiraceae bacterium]